MNVIVTGAASFLGLAVLRQLLEHGHQVTAVVRPGSKNRAKLLQHEGLAVLELDMKDIGHLCGRIPNADIFLHMAWGGVGSAGRQDVNIQKENIDCSILAVRTAAALGCRRFVFSGSQAEYGIQSDIIYEDVPCRPVSEYGKAKLEFGNHAKTLCKSLKIEYIHTRIFSVYGPGDHPWSLVSSCLRTWKQGGHMELGDCLQLWNYLYIDDAARGLTALMEQGSGGIYNLAGADTRVLRSYIEEMYAACGGTGSYEYGKRKPNAEGSAPLQPAIDKIRNRTGFRPQVSFAEGINETLYCMRREFI